MIRKVFLSLAIMLAFASLSNAQKKLKDAPGEKKPEEKEIIYTHIEQMPEFRGNKTALVKYLLKNTNYPEEAKAKGIQGKVIVKFIVDKKGKIKNPKVVRGIGHGCDEEAIRVISKMPDWKPGMEKGKPVSTYFNLPVLFKLDSLSSPEVETQSVPPVELNNSEKPNFISTAADSVHFNKGMNQMKAREYNAAVESFSEALKINPKNDRSLLYRGSVYYKLKELDKACNDWGQSSEMGNTDAANLMKKYCKR
jgi:TonB family protein